jgi:hypothetical protein
MFKSSNSFTQAIKEIILNSWYNILFGFSYLLFRVLKLLSDKELTCNGSWKRESKLIKYIINKIFLDQLSKKIIQLTCECNMLMQ